MGARYAFLVVHGIGHQNPIETIDQFGRTLVRCLEKRWGSEIEIEHRLSRKERSDKQDFWFDNYLHIRRKDDEKEEHPTVDLYEYYWAHHTEDQASLTDISRWVSGVTTGARNFYTAAQNRKMGESYGDSSFLFRAGKFKYGRYRFTTYLFGALLPAISFFSGKLLEMLSYIPVVGIPFRSMFSSFLDSRLKRLANVIGDIIIYNTTDQKSKFYRIRQEILTGAVKAIRNLLEQQQDRLYEYDKIVIAGHSLGSQVSYDAINRLIHLINAGAVRGFEGNQKHRIQEVMAGFVTFGSPLDKIAFFLRETVGPKEYIRAQILKNYHAFKQRDWTMQDGGWPHTIQPVFERLLEEMPWLNFYDIRDYVSGNLDYYQNLDNIDLKFKSRFYSFTHGLYWESDDMFETILERLLPEA